jgi:hypothetical protein
MPMPAHIRLGERDRTATQPQITAAPAVCRDNAARSTGDACGYAHNHLISCLF